MTLFQLITRAARRYIFCQQAILTWAAVFCLYVLFFHHQQLGRFIQVWKVKVWTGLFGNRYNVPTAPRPQLSADINAAKTKASWELRKGNIGLYAIQGRRQHMEDRFNVVDDLEHTGSGTSIYGIFDGHGGEVSEMIIHNSLTILCTNLPGVRLPCVVAYSQ